MPVTLNVATHSANKWEEDKVTNTEQLLKCSCPQNHRRSEGLIQSSFSDALCKKSHVSSSKHGFVYAIYKAYSYHHHLVLRPEDVWVSILTQLNFYINKHAEELRSMFVSHEGQKELRVKEVGSIDTVDFGRLAVRMTEEIERNVLDPELRTWIMPSFTSTTDTDRVVAAILMMGTMQKYFSYVMDLLCGIPSVTLLGERDDWAQLVAKLDKIPQFGEEPAKFATLLKPVLTRFLESFDDPDSPELVTFWDKCAHYIAGGSGPDYISGWITAFCFWDEDGNCLYQNAKDYFAHFEGEDDHIKYHLIESEAIPAGHASVPVKVNDNGKEYDTTMVAGSVAIHAMPRGFMLNATYGTANATHERSQTSKADESISVDKSPYEPELDTIQPLSGWWMYLREDPAKAKAREEELKEVTNEIDKLQSMDFRTVLDQLHKLWARQTELEQF